MTPAEPVSQFRLRRRVRFYETDAAGIVHFSIYPRFMEEAEHELWRATGLNIAPGSGEVGFPRVSMTCDYKSPLRFDDEFEVSIRIIAITHRSIRYASVVSRGDAVVAYMTMAVVCVTREADGTMRPVAIPGHVRSRLAVSSDAAAMVGNSPRA
jgi:acyl-CoA thioester hydrolase